ncbi:hypothetical protein [Anaerosalibacter massiliensis]|uniref:Ethanolamine utilization protein n=1 Tax=Anaerosalibacter massiliensis TaxID=1347392 RepID=A0A9X2S6N9_9FIRM|nr:hypothetical protein [Anaerosalibacter massiliensis]MCR2043832.1 hypothetical protein [Anaerosalibacter massiliensis]
MEIDVLVQKIVSEVLKKIEEEKNTRKRKILFLEPKSEDTKLRYSMFISDWKDIYFIDEPVDSILDYDLIICPKLDIKDLVDISNGRPYSKISSIIIDAMLNGLRVVCLEEGIYYRKFKESSNEEFYIMLTEYEKKLLSFGIEIMRGSQIKYELNNIDNGKDSSLKQEHHLEKKVITQADIKSLYNNEDKNITIEKNSLITPLAKDYIEENNLEIRKV